MEPLFLVACEEGSTSIVSKYIRKVLNVNYCDRSDGSTGLMKACANGHYEIVKMLLDANANVDQKDFSGQNALHYAIKGNHEKISKLLCTKKVNATAKTNISKMISREYALTAVNTGDKPSTDKEYVVHLKNIKKAEDSHMFADYDEPKCVEDRIHNLILRYDDHLLSDMENSDDEQKGEAYSKKKKGKKGKKGKGKKAGKSGKGKGKKKKGKK